MIGFIFGFLYEREILAWALNDHFGEGNQDRFIFRFYKTMVIPFGSSLSWTSN